VPHIDAGERPVLVNYRLADALPQSVLVDLRDRIQSLPESIRDAERRKRIEGHLDAGHGECLLAPSESAALVEEPLLFHDNRRYRLHAWVVMPNHVHVLFTPQQPIGPIINTWKSYSALQIHRQLERTGSLWQPDYFDRLIRNDDHFNNAVAYIESNPVKAGLCATPAE
jgi:hypothetical protein